MHLLRAAMTAGFVLGSFIVTSAQAAPIVSIQLAEAGFAPKIVSSDPMTGFAKYDGAYGSYTLNVTTGVGEPTLPPSLGIDLNSINVKGAGGSALTLFITEQGLTSPRSTLSYIGSIGGTFSASTASVAYSAYADSTNAAFGMEQQLGSTTIFTSSPYAGVVSGAASGLLGMFSITEKVVLNTMSGVTNVSFNAQLTPVPLPASAPLFGAALAMLGLVGYGLKRKKTTAPA